MVMSTSVTVHDRLLEIALLLQDDLARSFEGTALTTARTHLLWEVAQRGPCTQQALATAMKVSARNITGLLDALEAAGYARRSPHPGDRRATLVSLTDLGAQTMATMARQREDAAAELVVDLDPERLEQLGESLGVVAARLRAMIAAGASTGARS